MNIVGCEFFLSVVIEKDFRGNKVFLILVFLFRLWRGCLYRKMFFLLCCKCVKFIVFGIGK